jgi:adenylylsulfate kinase
LIQGWCIWLTGLPGSGKSTIAKITIEKILEKGIRLQILSSDELRKIITPDPKYTDKERDIVYGSIAYIAKLLTINGANVLIDATGNRRKYRDNCRAIIGRFKEIYLRCTVNVCIERERKRTGNVLAPNQIYKKTAIVNNTVPGFGSPYEEPLNPDLIIDTDKLDAEKSAELIVDHVLTDFR